MVRERCPSAAGATEAKISRGAGGRAGTGRLRRALTPTVYGLGVALACVLWIGVAAPGLRLLPGLDGFGDRSIAISLQSALLGIDDGGGRPSLTAARTAAQSLGLISGRELLLGPRARRAAVRPGPIVAALATPFAAGGTAESPAPARSEPSRQQ